MKYLLVLLANFAFFLFLIYYPPAFVIILLLLFIGVYWAHKDEVGLVGCILATLIFGAPIIWILKTTLPL